VKKKGSREGKTEGKEKEKENETTHGCGARGYNKRVSNPITKIEIETILKY